MYGLSKIGLWMGYIWIRFFVPVIVILGYQCDALFILRCFLAGLACSVSLSKTDKMTWI